MPHELTERQMENRRATSEILLLRHEKKRLFHRIITGDEKWIYFENPKRKKSWLSPGEASTSTARPNRFGKKIMLCVWWDQKGIVYYELVKPGETVQWASLPTTTNQFKPCIVRKTARMGHKTRTSDIAARQRSVPSHFYQNTLKTLKWDLLPHPSYSPDLAPFQFSLVPVDGAWLGWATLGQFRICKIGWMNDFGPKTRRFIVAVFMYCQRDDKNV